MKDGTLCPKCGSDYTVDVGPFLNESRNWSLCANCGNKWGPAKAVNAFLPAAAVRRRP